MATSISTATATVINPYALVVQELNQLSQGEIAFNPPERISMGVRTRVAMRIARHANTPDITTNMPGLAVATVEPIRVGRFMGAELTSDAFDIKQLSNRDQVVEENSTSQWEWEIVAQKFGLQSLHLHVWARVVSPPVPEQTKDISVLDKDVDVQVNPPYLVGQFASGNWQWVLGSGFTASLAALVWKLRDHIPGRTARPNSNENVQRRRARRR